MKTPIPWHRLFGIALTDLFTGRPWRVELEKELALKSQRLDLLIIERCDGAASRLDAAALDDLPDGLEALAAHNVLTYKSQHQALDAWALDELVSHYVTYRKLLSIQLNQADPERIETLPERLVPASDFRLYAVATRSPDKLFGQLPAGVHQAGVCPGVHDLYWGGQTVRLIVLNAIAEHPRNAPWELFSARIDRIRHGLRHYHPRDAAASELLTQLYFNYRLEIPDMAYTMEDFKRETRGSMIEFILHECDPEERQALIDQLAVEERLRGLDPEERLRGLDPELIKSWLNRSGH